MRASALKQTVSRRALEMKSATGDPETTETKKAIDDLGQAWAAFKTANEAQLAEIKKGMKDVVTEEKVARISDALDKLQAAKDAAEQKAKDRMDDIEKQFGRMKLVGGTDVDGKGADLLAAFNNEVKSFTGIYGKHAPAEFDQAALDTYRAGFKSYLRRGDKELSADQTKAMTVGSDPDGGYLVTPDTSGRIITRVRDLSPIRQIASVQSITTDSLEGAIDRDDVEDGWVAETEDRDDTDTPTVGKWKIEAFEQYACPKVSQKLLEDSSIDIEAWLSAKLGNRFARTEGTAFVTGSGVGKPKGFTAYTLATTDDATRAFGSLQYLKTGVNGDFAVAAPADKLFDFMALFMDAYLQNARFVTRREVIAKIRKFKNAAGDYLWSPGLSAGQPQTLLTFPVTIAQDMPALATNGVSLALGDFAEGYLIVDRLGIQTLRDPYTAKPWVKFYTRRRVGGGVVNFDAIKFLQFAA